MSKEGVIILFYDVLMKTKTNIKNYVSFHKKILGNGFIMMQESVYFRYFRNTNLAKYTIERVLQNAPKESNIKIIKLTIKQFERMNAYSTKKQDLSLYRNNTIVL